MQLAEQIYQDVQREGLSIGHLKFLIDDTIKISYTASENEPAIIQTKNSASATILINARIQATPVFLSTLISKAIAQTEKENNCIVVEENFASFQPGYPTPTHRIVV
jgi:hypothetical protein